MMGFRKVLGIAVAVVTAALVVTSSAGAAGGAPQFGGKPAVVGVEAFCVTQGSEAGQVYVDVAVRYRDAKGVDESLLSRVHSHMRILGSGGRVLATDDDWGRSQPDIPGLSSYVHTHQHQLDRADSARVLEGKRCTPATARLIDVEVHLSQRLGPGANARTATATVSDSAASTSAAIVEGVNSAPTVTDGCVYDSKGQMDCAGAFLQGASFVGQRVPYANFSFANMFGADLAEVAMGHVTMNQTDLDQANLSGAEMGSASLTSASLIGANLTGAQLLFANLANANLSEAKLESANLTGANLVGTQFDSTTCNTETRFPAGFPFRCSNGIVAKN